MFKKRGKMGQPVKNGTRYKKCTLVDFLLKIARIWQFHINIVKNEDIDYKEVARNK